ncbi:MAG: FAD-binding protein [Legionellales bacterium]|nr:FAD-binding protein [Legionellales bacterium]
MMNLIHEFKKSVSLEQILTEKSELIPYSFDYSGKHCLPLAVILVHSHEEVVNIVKTCAEHAIPIVARGRGTGTPGGAVPVGNGIVLSFERMQTIIHIDPANRVMQAETGVLNSEIQHAAQAHGFFWAPDPSSFQACTLGGNLAYNSAGPRALKYGSTRENVLGLTAVTGTGETITCGVYTTKGVVGYDLTRLIIGSEGTLALITKATLKLLPLPQTKICLQLFYQSLEEATHAVSAIMAQPVIPYALEFIDDFALQLIRENTTVEIPANAAAMLMIELDGLPSMMNDAVQSIYTAANHAGLLVFKHATAKKDVEQLWQARRSLSPILRSISPKKISEDIVVPVSRLADFVRFTQTLSQKYQIKMVNYGHAGNGNIHANILIDEHNPHHWQQVNPLLTELFDYVLSIQGTLSGEHGVGLEKRDFIAKELDHNALKLMRAIKQQFDPFNILNPGKLLPDEH